MGDNFSASTYMLLSQQLYNSFVQYISEGRCRAPPGCELIELIPTFQFGAKTDRRALQSKFKSWARRMTLMPDNDKLHLTSSGKCIIPMEKCKDLVMSLHSEKHVDIETIITQIKMKYVWSRRNFGMDRDFVVETIARNCSNEDCVQAMIRRFSQQFFKGSPTLLPQVVPCFDSNIKGTPLPLQYHPSMACYRVPFPFSPPVFPPNASSFQQPLFDPSMFREGCTTLKNFQTSVNYHDKENIIFDKLNGENRVFSSERITFPLKPSTDGMTELMKFKKCENICTYKAVMKDVKQNPNRYPEILRNEKTQYLAMLGIVPTKICSLKTLKRFREENKRRIKNSALSVIYRKHKSLRDRNKLKNSTNGRRTFLEMQNRSHVLEPKEQSLNGRSSNKKLRFLKYQKRDRKPDTSDKSLDNDHKEPVEVIDIVSSDDENMKESFSTMDDVPIVEKQTAAQEQSNEKRDTNPLKPDDASPQTANVVRLNIDNIPKMPFIYYPVKPISSNLSKSVPRQKPLKKRFLLPKNVKLNETSVKQMGIRIPVQQLCRPVPKIVRPMFGQYQNNSANLVFPQCIKTHVGLRQTAPKIVQFRPRFPASNQNVTPRVIYPVPIAKLDSGSKLFLVEKDKARSLLGHPQFSIHQDCQRKATATNNIISNLQSSVITPRDKNPPQSSSITDRKLLDENKTTETAKVHDESMEASEEKGAKQKTDIGLEMRRITNWIYRMKAALNPTMFQSGIEKPVQKMIAQLDIGICLVREAREALLEVEQVTDCGISSDENCSQ